MNVTSKAVLITAAILCLATAAHQGLDMDRVGTGVFLFALACVQFMVVAYES